MARIGSTMWLRRFAALAVGLTLANAPTAATARPAPLFLIAPVPTTVEAPQLAIMVRIKLQLPTGQGLARALIQSGVSKGDAAVAAKLAAGHLGDGAGGCLANVTISKSAGSEGFRLERVLLAAASGQTTIERRDGGLAIVATDESAGALRLV